MLKRYVIEREMPGVGNNTAQGFGDAAARSNAALEKLGTGIQWVQSFVTGDKIFCIYLASNEKLIRDHANVSGFPATRIHEVRTVLDPTSAKG